MTLKKHLSGRKWTKKQIAEMTKNKRPAKPFNRLPSFVLTPGYISSPNDASITKKKIPTSLIVGMAKMLHNQLPSMQRLVAEGEVPCDLFMYPLTRRFEMALDNCVWKNPKQGVRFTMKVILTATTMAQP